MRRLPEDLAQLRPDRLEGFWMLDKPLAPRPAAQSCRRLEDSYCFNLPQISDDIPLPALVESGHFGRLFSPSVAPGHFAFAISPHNPSSLHKSLLILSRRSHSGSLDGILASRSSIASRNSIFRAHTRDGRIRGTCSLWRCHFSYSAWVCIVPYTLFAHIYLSG